jgi:hypothetical protein
MLSEDGRVSGVCVVWTGEYASRVIVEVQAPESTSIFALGAHI